MVLDVLPHEEPVAGGSIVRPDSAAEAIVPELCVGSLCEIDAVVGGAENAKCRNCIDPERPHRPIQPAQSHAKQGKAPHRMLEERARGVVQHVVWNFWGGESEPQLSVWWLFHSKLKDVGDRCSELEQRSSRICNRPLVGPTSSNSAKCQPGRPLVSVLKRKKVPIEQQTRERNLNLQNW